MLRRILVIAILLSAPSGATAGLQSDQQHLKDLSIEQLMEIRVTLVTRQPEPVGTAAAAVTVITRDDIRRSGVTTIADALALVDGVHVARFNNSSWSISARGFNGSTPNKLLVMVDGRNEFTPLFTGVFWNLLDYVLDDIDRIEVIRGPGATLWGANAVNGVVNIVTRHSRDTRGTLISAAVGPEDPGIFEMRHGGGSEALSYRVYGKFAQRDAQRFAAGGSSEDGRRRGLTGLRVDGSQRGYDWMFKADVFHSRDDFIDRGDGEWTGIGAQGRLSRRFSPRASFQVQSYYRREYRNVERQLTHHLDTVDVDFQNALQLDTRNHFIWGAGYRRNADKTYGSPQLRFDPVSRTYPVFSAFVQDELTLRPDSLAVTAGLKVEHNAFSGADWQPSLRARWVPRRHHVIWSAVARAVRRPTRFDDDLFVFAPGGALLIAGSNDFASEAMTGVEVGYRSQPWAGLSVEAVGFVQDYDRLRSQEAPLGGLIPLTLANTLNGSSTGVELAASVQPASWWRVRVSYTRLDVDITRDANSRDVSGGANETNDPSNLFTLRAAADLTRNVEADAWLRRVGSLPNPRVPAYAELNARLGWRPTSTLELALVGQDLLHDRHPELGPPTPSRIEFQRSVRVSMTVRMP